MVGLDLQTQLRVVVIVVVTAAAARPTMRTGMSKLLAAPSWVNWMVTMWVSPRSGSSSESIASPFAKKAECGVRNAARAAARPARRRRHRA
jgi:hypothetical protein